MLSNDLFIHNNVLDLNKTKTDAMLSTFVTLRCVVFFISTFAAPTPKTTTTKLIRL